MQKLKTLYAAAKTQHSQIKHTHTHVAKDGHALVVTLSLPTSAAQLAGDQTGGPGTRVGGGGVDCCLQCLSSLEQNQASESVL